MSCNSCGIEVEVEGCLHAESFDLACRNCGDWITRGDPSVRRGRWYVVLAGETLGPLRTEVVADLLGKQLLDEEEGVWREGFGAWRPLHTVPELAPFVAPRAEPTTILSIDEIELEALPGEDATGWETTLEPRSPQRVAMGAGGHVHRLEPAPVAGDLIVARPRVNHLRLVDEPEVELVEVDPIPVARRPAPPRRISRLPQPPAENSVVFSLRTLERLVDGPRLDPGPSLPAFTPKNLLDASFDRRPAPLPTSPPGHVAPAHVAPAHALPFAHAYPTNATISLAPVPRRRPGRLAVVAILWCCVGALLALAVLTRFL